MENAEYGGQKSMDKLLNKHNILQNTWAGEI